MLKDITNHSLNSAAAVRFGILKEGAVHDFFVLRQAELSVRSYRRDLFAFNQEVELRERNLKVYLERFQVLRRRQEWRLNPLFGVAFRIKDWFYKILRLPSEEQEFFQLGQAISKLNHDIQYIDKDRRDFQMQLEVALQEKDAFYSRHPEFSSMTYEEIQEEISGEALLNRIGIAFAADLWAGQQGSAFRTLMELSPEQIQYVLAREVELRDKIEGHNYNTRLFQIMQDVMPEEREQVLVSTLATVRQQSLTDSYLFPATTQDQ